jgi:hypothetical protein
MDINVTGKFEADEVVLEDLQIDKHKTSLKIRKSGLDGKGIIFVFGCGFEINVCNGVIRFNRAVIRPNHDHDDNETLVQNRKTKEIKFGKVDESWGVLEIKFGPITVSY